MLVSEIGSFVARKLGYANLLTVFIYLKSNLTSNEYNLKLGYDTLCFSVKITLVVYLVSSQIPLKLLSILFDDRLVSLIICTKAKKGDFKSLRGPVLRNSSMLLTFFQDHVNF